MRLERSMRFIGRSKRAEFRERSSESNQEDVKPDTAQSRLNFQKEISQNQKFEGTQYIRQLLDVIEDSARGEIDPCGMVLASFPEIVWEVRENGRLSTFGLAGIRCPPQHPGIARGRNKSSMSMEHLLEYLTLDLHSRVNFEAPITATDANFKLINSLTSFNWN
ncbi:hypothetical protein ACJ72_04095 [Emergomyces africanus]|uniref:Uncharacterized protein n=1 Tax=Emergomyces africanus TaxID=1955775 RepID=A0A1B7NXR2_9EURO|nr:hypothetical protein ACJ72_04095 [Emergomyces africanus]